MINIIKKINYIPFVGWLPAMTLIKDDEFMDIHSHNGFVLATIFAIIPIALTVIILIIPNNFRLLQLIATILLYISHTTYLILYN